MSTCHGDKYARALRKSFFASTPTTLFHIWRPVARCCILEESETKNTNTSRGLSILDLSKTSNSTSHGAAAPQLQRPYSGAVLRDPAGASDPRWAGRASADFTEFRNTIMCMTFDYTEYLSCTFIQVLFDYREYSSIRTTRDDATRQETRRDETTI